MNKIRNSGTKVYEWIFLLKNMGNKWKNSEF